MSGTHTVDNVAVGLDAMGCQVVHSTSRRTGINETKANPTIRLPNHDANWGCPKRTCRKAIAVELE